MFRKLQKKLSRSKHKEETKDKPPIRIAVGSKSREEARNTEGHDIDHIVRGESAPSSSDVDTTHLDVFSFEHLHLMTQNFSNDNVLGTYKFATVFKGTIPNHHADMHVTIKLLNGGNPESNARRLKNEIWFLVNPKVNNCPYLPKILGSCCDNNTFAIVYYLKSDCILNTVVSREGLRWADRIFVGFKIALLLQYLHEHHPHFTFDNILDCHVILDEGRNPILYEFGMLDQMGDLDETSSSSVHAFGNILITLLGVDEEHRRLMYRIERIIVDGDTWNLYQKRYFGTFSDSDRFNFVMSPVCFCTHPHYYSYDAHKLSRLAIRCISNNVDERPSIDEIVGEFNRLFYVSINVSTSLPINHHGIVEELKFSDIKSITKGLTTLIGDTLFGYLYRGSYRGTTVTVKVFRDTPTMCPRTLHTALKDRIHRLKDEISFIRDKRSSNFPCLPNLLAFSCGKDGVAVVYNFETERTLYSFIEDDKVSWGSRIDVIYQVARLLQCMHNYDPRFIVGNISSHHFLLDKDMRMVIVDFGLLTGGFLGVKKEHKYQKFEGAAGYIDGMSQFTGEWTPRVDVNAFGVLVLELLNKCYMVDRTTWKDSPLLRSLLRFRMDGPLPTESIINNSLKSDPFYYDVDASDLVSVALRSISYPLQRWDINEIIRQLDGLMLFRPSKHMYLALEKKLRMQPQTSHAQPVGSSSQYQAFVKNLSYATSTSYAQPVGSSSQ